MVIKSLILALALTMTVTISAEEKKANESVAKEATTSKEKAKEMVNKGAAFAKKNGLDALLKEINEKKTFTDGELYLFAIDKKCVTLAHGANKGLIGKDQTNLVDADGKAFFQEFVKVATTKGSGWVDYKWSNPTTKKIQEKTTYIFAVPGMDLILGCGIYK